MTLTHLMLSFVLAYLSCAAVTAQQPSPQPSPSPTPTKDSYIRRNSIGYKDSPTHTPNRISFQTRHISSWVGERFIFMPQQTSLQRFGYQLIHPIDDESGKLPYEDYVGKIAKVLAVAPSKHKIEGVWEVYMQIEETGEKLTGQAFLETLGGLANLQDVDDARAKYLGKTLRFTGQLLQRYNAVTDKVEYLSVPKNSPVKVTDIVVSWNNEAPLRFVVQTSTGEEGYVDVNMSGTNISKILREFHRFNDAFILQN